MRVARSFWRTLAALTGGIVALGAAMAAAAAQGSAPSAYPNRPIRLIVGQAPGGASDIVARSFARRLGDVLGQQIVIDNRAGAGGLIGAEIVAHANADGYTLLLGTNGPIAISPSVMAKPPYQPLRDFAPVVLFSEVPYVVVVHPSVKATSLSELIALAKAQPGKLQFGSSGQAGTPHLCSELFKVLAGVDILHVPYRGGAPAQVDLIAGRVQMYCAGFPSLLPHIKAGRVRALAVTAPERNSAMREVPTAAEAGLRGFEVSAWNGILAPAGTPAAIVDRLFQASRAVMRKADFEEELRGQGVDAVVLGPREFSSYISRETEKWARVVKAAKLEER